MAKRKKRYITGVRSAQNDVNRLDFNQERNKQIGGQLGTLAGSLIPVPGANLLTGFIGGKIGGAFGKGKRKEAQEELKKAQFVQEQNEGIGIDKSQFIAQKGLATNEQPIEEFNKPLDVEVEKDETVFRKIGDRFKLIADFQGGKTHTQGGEDIEILPGDVIIPGSKRSEILPLLNANGTVTRLNEPKFESIRLSLPSDTKEDKEGDETAQEGLNTSGTEEEREINPFTKTLKTIGKGVEKGFEVAPIISNFIRGTTAPDPFVIPDLVPIQEESVNLPNESLRQVRNQRRLATENARNTGGNLGAFLSNAAVVDSAAQDAVGEIEAQNTVQNVSGVGNRNINRANEFALRNQLSGLQEQIINEQNEAAARNFLGSEVPSALSQLSQRDQAQKSIAKRDEKALRAEIIKALVSGSVDFTLDDVDQLFDFFLNGGTPPQNLIKLRESSRNLRGNNAEAESIINEGNSVDNSNKAGKVGAGIGSNILRRIGRF